LRPKNTDTNAKTVDFGDPQNRQKKKISYKKNISFNKKKNLPFWHFLDTPKLTVLALVSAFLGDPVGADFGFNLCKKMLKNAKSPVWRDPRG
jgi:hypothetical protein